MGNRRAVRPQFIHAPGKRSQRASPSGILNCVSKNDAVDLLSAETGQRQSQVDDHSAGRVECNGVRHIKQAPSKRRLGGDETRNQLRRVVRILVSLPAPIADIGGFISTNDDVSHCIMLQSNGELVEMYY
jgi:hypothetical protein